MLIIIDKLPVSPSFQSPSLPAAGVLFLLTYSFLSPVSDFIAAWYENIMRITATE